mgnify:CR=1 FL=1|jgi:hypothetical protein
MKAHLVSIIHSLSLICLGTWGYFGSEVRPVTALIPVAIGVILIALNGGVKKENKVVAHIAALLTVIILLGLLKPLSSQLSAGDVLGTFRVGTMTLTTLWAISAFVKSFISARKKKS